MIRVAVIGCGEWGKNHIRVLSELKGVEVTALCDLSADTLDAATKSFPKALRARNHRDVLKNEGVDGVIISTPASTHGPLVLEALRAGKHVLVEKPLCVDVQEAEEIASQALKGDRLVMVAHTFLYNPGIQYLYEAIKKGGLGKIFYLYSTRTNLGPIRTDVNAVWDLAPHDISIINFLLGGLGGSLPVRVRASGGVFLKSGTVDVGFITLEYGNGTLGHIHVSWLDPNKVRRVTVVGDRKMAYFDDLDTSHPVRIFDKGVMHQRYRKPYESFEDFRLIVRSGSCEMPHIPKREPLKMEVQEFLARIKGRKVASRIIQREVDLGIRVLRVLDAVSRSLNNGGKPVEL
ncbi:MAG: Gfo/Idh/MocA family oxidoreductase [Candidatus Omnitrophica bacterium]|nr:Gfo/Idh/MocA family oxidoreductase [Candidatus Omnitrophota bacterium]